MSSLNTLILNRGNWHRLPSVSVVAEKQLLILRAKKKKKNWHHLPCASRSRRSFCFSSPPSLLAPPCHSALLSFLLIYQTSSFPCCHIWYRWLGSIEWPVSLHSAASVWQGAWWLVKGPWLSQHMDTDISQRSSHAHFPPGQRREMKNLELTQSRATGYESQEWREERRRRRGNGEDEDRFRRRKRKRRR